MAAYNVVLNRVLKDIKPTKSEVAGLTTRVAEFKAILASKLPYEIFVGGSFAKGTWLRGIKDIDIFVRFPYSKFKDKSDELSDILEEYLNGLFKHVTRLHGSRDYFRVEHKGIRFEIVPILKISKPEEAMNITDVSPLHVEWVKSKADAKARDEIRLLKGFVKANKLYGAESYRRGFSGYGCEILTLCYGGFLGLIRDAAKWRPGKLLDPEGYYKTREQAIMALNKSKITALVVIDPVQPTRNATAALSKANLLHFVELAKGFLKEPSIEYFKLRVVKEKELRKRYQGKPVVWLVVKPLEGKEDIIGAKLLKCFEYIAKSAALYGFKIIERGWDWVPGKPAQMWFVFKGKIPKEHMIIGPPLKEVDHVKRFREKHKRCLIRDGKVVAIETRSFTEPREFLLGIIKSDYIKRLVTKIELK